jgi:hypothetical protein
MTENDDEMSKFYRSALQPGDGDMLAVGHEPPNTWLERASTKFRLSSNFPHSAPIITALIESVISVYYYARE